MKHEYVKLAKVLPELSQEFIDAMNKQSQEKDKFMFWATFSNHRNKLYLVLDFLIRVDDEFERVRYIAIQLGHERRLHWGSKDDFLQVIEEINKEYNRLKETRVARLLYLDKEEEERIDEAFHTLKEGCYWSSIVNCAVAFEKRLFLILNQENLEFLKLIKPDLRFTFGDLAKAYLDNKTEFKHCIPDRHDDLLGLVNKYRILSAHPKQFRINRAKADALFNLTIDFLLDEDCQPPKKRG